MKWKTLLITSVFSSQRFLHNIFLLILFISQTSCFQHFYLTKTTTKVDTSVLNQPAIQEKYLIIHTPIEVFSLKNAKVSNEILSGDRDSVNPKYEKYLTPIEGESKRLKKKEAETVFSVVNLFTKEAVENGHINLPVDKIFQIDEYVVDKKADKGSNTASIIGIVVGSVAVVAFGFAVSNNLNFGF